MTAPRILITDEHQRIIEVDFRDIAPVSKPRIVRALAWPILISAVLWLIIGFVIAGELQ